MTKLFVFLAFVGTTYLMDGIWDIVSKRDWKAFIRFLWMCALAFVGKCIAKLVIWMINF